MELKKLVIWQFRNLENGSTEVAPGTNLISGSNGQGKTNFLEAIAVVGNVRSFRQATVRKMVRHGDRAFRLEAWVEYRQQTVHLRQIVECGTTVSRCFEINGVVVPLEQYLLQFPVFTLSSEDTALVNGAPEHRRAFVDRMAFFFDSNHLEDLTRFRTILRQRNATLSGHRSQTEMELWEDQLARAAAVVVDRRVRVVNQWKAGFQSMYQALRGRGFPDLDVVYRTELKRENLDKETVAEFYRRRYYEYRVRDCRAGFTLDGPHRHDLTLRTGGRPVRDVLSAGQVKIVAVALWMSNLAQVEERRNEHLPVLVDDVDAELDDRVFSKLVDSLGHTRQVIMTSAHDRGMVDVIPAATWWSMIEGKIQRRNSRRGSKHD